SELASASMGREETSLGIHCSPIKRPAAVIPRYRTATGGANSMATTMPRSILAGANSHEKRAVDGNAVARWRDSRGRARWQPQHHHYLSVRSSHSEPFGSRSNENHYRLP